MGEFHFGTMLIWPGVFGAIGVVVLLIRLLLDTALVALGQGARIKTLIGVGYTEGGLVRLIALALLTPAIFPVGLLVALIIGAGEWEGHRDY